MPRMRMLKPSFFSNDVLAEIPPLGRLLFQGLWCLADRAGRLEDRPKRIKAEILPYDDEADVDELLSDLTKLGFITRYAHDGRRFIQVNNFSKHQNPHVKEPPSTIPAPDEHHASPVQEPDKPQNGTSPAVQEHIQRQIHTPPPYPPQGEDPEPPKPTNRSRRAKPERTPITGDDVDELVEKYFGAFGSRQVVRDEIAAALNHEARYRNFKERLYVDNWLRKTVGRQPPIRLLNGGQRPTSRVVDRTGVAN